MKEDKRDLLLPKQAVEELKQLYQQKYDITLSDGHATLIAKKYLNLFELLSNQPN